jgi:hypothetical protein
MAITYTITVDSLEGAPSLNNKTNVVTGVEYTLTGTHTDGTEAIATGWASVELDADNFVEFNNLTEDIVKGWITSQTDHYNAYKNIVNSLISEIQTPTKQSLTKPW